MLNGIRVKLDAGLLRLAELPWRNPSTGKAALWLLEGASVIGDAVIGTTSPSAHTVHGGS